MRRAALVVLALAVLVPLRAGASGATFVASSANPAGTFTTAADFNTVAVALADPGTYLRGTVALTATAASDRGIASVRLQTAPAGTTTWTDVCTDTVAPYGCALDTTTVADGLRDVRAVATDAAGYSRTATVASRRVDNTAPATALTDPGTPLTGTAALGATASDGGSGVASSMLQYRLSPSGAWTDICAQASCSLNTATLADGLYDLRSLVTDNAGNTGTSVVGARRVDNTAPTVTLPALGAMRGTVTVAATAGDGNGTGVTSIRYQMRPSGTTTWTDVCTAAAAPFSCSAVTTGVPDGLYEARAIATDGAGFTTTSAIVSGRVDNAAPTTATLADPGTPLSGTVTLTGTAADAGSGVASVRFQRSPAGAATWTDVCNDTATPYTCAWDTTGVADALYDLRTLVTDSAGNTLASAVVANRRVDNNGPTVSLTDPGSPLRGSVTVAATASDPAGMGSVTIQRRTSSTGAWVTICTDNSASYSCAWNTAALTDGLYDLRATATDALGRTSTSAIVSARRIDNTAPAAADIQAVNGTGVAGTVDAGDVITFTYSEAMNPNSILAGWDGTSRTVTVRVTNAGGGDTLSVWDAANTTRLNLTSTDVQLKANRTAAGARFAATATLSGAQVTVTLTGLASGATTASASTTPMVWTPSTAATDLAGNATAGTAATESGTADVDF